MISYVKSSKGFTLGACPELMNMKDVVEWLHSTYEEDGKLFILDGQKKYIEITGLTIGKS